MWRDNVEKRLVRCGSFVRVHIAFGRSRSIYSLTPTSRRSLTRRDSICRLSKQGGNSLYPAMAQRADSCRIWRRKRTRPDRRIRTPEPYGEAGRMGKRVSALPRCTASFRNVLNLSTEKTGRSRELRPGGEKRHMTRYIKVTAQSPCSGGKGLIPCSKYDSESCCKRHDAVNVL